MTWNIRNGGGDRLPAIAAVIAGQRPDVLALQELRGFPAAAFAARLNLVGQVAPSVFGQPVGVFVRPELAITRRSAVRWRLHHAAAAVTVRTGEGSLTVVSAHLNPYAPERRRREAVWLAARFGGRGPLVLAGDLNSLSADAPVPAAYRRRHLAPDGSVDTRAMAALARAGLTDAWLEAGDRGDDRAGLAGAWLEAGDRGGLAGAWLEAGEGVGDRAGHRSGERAGCTVPTGLGGAEFGPMRLDYVLLGGGLRAVSARVVRDDPLASDHYPLVVELR